MGMFSNPFKVVKDYSGALGIGGTAGLPILGNYDPAKTAMGVITGNGAAGNFGNWQDYMQRFGAGLGEQFTNMGNQFGGLQSQFGGFAQDTTKKLQGLTDLYNAQSMPQQGLGNYEDLGGYGNWSAFLQPKALQSGATMGSARLGGNNFSGNNFMRL